MESQYSSAGPDKHISVPFKNSWTVWFITLLTFAHSRWKKIIITLIKATKGWSLGEFSIKDWEQEEEANQIQLPAPLKLIRQHLIRGLFMTYKNRSVKIVSYLFMRGCDYFLGIMVSWCCILSMEYFVKSIFRRGRIYKSTTSLAVLCEYVLFRQK